MHKITKNNRKGFTLIELLVVIAIIAVLAVVVILSLNPAELLKQARDSNRVSDLSTLKSAISLYLADVSVPSIGTYTYCRVSDNGTSFYSPDSTGSTANSTSSCTAWFPTATVPVASSTGAATTTASRNVDGTGWVPVNFNAISSGSPIGQEPVDPTNTSGTASAPALFYSYTASSTAFKIGAFMESSKYSNGGGGDVESTDGGKNPYVFESGTNLSL